MNDFRKRRIARPPHNKSRANNIKAQLEAQFEVHSEQSNVTTLNQPKPGAKQDTGPNKHSFAQKTTEPYVLQTMLEEATVASSKKVWTTIYLDQSLITYFNDVSYYFDMPEGSGYEGYGFWHPKKFVVIEEDEVLKETCRELKFSFGQDFTFNIYKYEYDAKVGKKKRKKIRTLDATEFAKIFAQYRKAV